LLRTPGGRAWWHDAKHKGFFPAFVADVDAMLVSDSGAAH
jgi:hypothetical protein